MQSVVPIYKNVICLEVYSKNGAKWWYQGGSLAYTPILISDIKQIAIGKIKGTNRTVYTTAIDFNGVAKMVAINMQRSDVWTMINKKLIPATTTLPRSQANYSQHPEKL